MHRVPCGGLHSLKGKACSRRPWSRRLMLRARLRSSIIYPQTSGGQWGAGQIGDEAQLLAMQLETRRKSLRGDIKPVGIPPGRPSIFPPGRPQRAPRSLTAWPLTPWAARGLLRWSQDALAEASLVSLPTIKRLEAQAGVLGGQRRTAKAIVTALETRRHRIHPREWRRSWRTTEGKAE